MIQITECPRDAMQGLHDFVPTSKKVEYINALLKVGFYRLDMGSFVSHKAIPQLKDTQQVLDQIDWENSSTELLVIIANQKGADAAVTFPQIKYLGYPFSVSETFQRRNTNAGIQESIKRLSEIQHTCEKGGKQLQLYLSMAFGNPYGEDWNFDIVTKWAELLYKELGLKNIALADTIGVSNTENIKGLYHQLKTEFPKLNLGLHLHSSPALSFEKIEAAFSTGCTHFDSAIMGYGGCPMAEDKLVGNIATENIIEYMESKEITHGLSKNQLNTAMTMAKQIFSAYN